MKALDAEVELDLIARAKRREPGAMDALFDQFQFMLKGIAKRVKGGDQDDRFQEACRWLIDCVDRFDPKRKACLSTLINLLIPMKLWRICGRDRVICIPHGTKKMKSHSQRVLDAMKQAERPIISLSGQAQYAVEIPSKFELPDLDEQDVLRKAHAAIKLLTPREQDILCRRMTDETLKSIGKSWNITRERVRQVEKMALAKLRAKIGIRKAS